VAILSEALHRRAIHLCLTTRPAIPQVANAFKGLAVIFQRRKCYDEGEQMFQQELDIFAKAYGIEDPSTISCAREYASMLRELDREDEAGACEARFEVDPIGWTKNRPSLDGVAG
jgi:Tetratricopeptide repeat